MKKLIIALLALFAIACYVWYDQGLQEQTAQTLIWAAYDGNLAEVKNALEDGATLNWLMYIDDPERDYHNAAMTPLLAAASGGNTKILRHLIKKMGQNPNQTNALGWTPLFVATRDGHAEAAAQLVLMGANPNAATQNGATALMLAVLSPFPTQKQRLSLLEYLLKKKADPNLYTRWQTDALYYALTANQDPAVVSLLLKYGADPCRTYQGQTPADLARKNKNKSALLPLVNSARQACPKASGTK